MRSKNKHFGLDSTFPCVLIQLLLNESFLNNKTKHEKYRRDTTRFRKV